MVPDLNSQIYVTAMAAIIENDNPSFPKFHDSELLKWADQCPANITWRWNVEGLKVATKSGLSSLRLNLWKYQI